MGYSCHGFRQPKELFESWIFPQDVRNSQIHAVSPALCECVNLGNPSINVNVNLWTGTCERESCESGHVYHCVYQTQIEWIWAFYQLHFPISVFLLPGNGVACPGFCFLAFTMEFSTAQWIPIPYSKASVLMHLWFHSQVVNSMQNSQNAWVFTQYLTSLPFPPLFFPYSSCLQILIPQSTELLAIS